MGVIFGRVVKPFIGIVVVVVVEELVVVVVGRIVVVVDEFGKFELGILDIATLSANNALNEKSELSICL
jgi:hypothetical protein